MEHTEFQKKGFAIAERHANLPLQNRLDIIAQTFGYKTAHVTTRPCTGKWRGTSDISIVFDNDLSLFIGNRRTPEAKKASTISEYVNNTLAMYNPETVTEAKKRAESALLKREAEDNAVAAELGLKPYKILNVEINDGSCRNDGYIGFYFVTLAVGDKIFGHLTSNLNYDITRGTVGDETKRRDYFVAGGLREGDEDYVFNNVGHSTVSGSYKMELSADVLQRAQKTLDRRNDAERQAKCIADLQAEKAEYERAIKEAETNIINRKTVLNTNLPNGYPLIMQLFKEHDITIPHKTQGWIINALADIHYNGKREEWDYNYFIKSNDSMAFSKYLPLLVSAVQTKQQYEEMNQDPCPLDGDTANDCADCAYSGDYHYQDGECVLRDDEEDMEI